MRSVAGCLTCRRRKLKCDEKRPSCGNCKKSSRSCEHGGLVFRHHQNPSLPRDDGAALDKYFVNRSSFETPTTWMPVPDEVTFVTEDPGTNYTTAPEQDTLSEPDLGGPMSPLAEGSCDTLEARVTSPTTGATGADILAMSQGSLDKPNFDYHRGSSGNHFLPLSDDGFEGLSPQMGTAEAQFRLSNNIKFILNPHPDVSRSDANRESNAELISTRTPLDSLAESPESHGSRVSQRPRQIETDPENAFLLRYFSEVPGKWLDLYFLEAYFELTVPVRALSHPLLKHSACAYAAKHLDRTKNKADSWLRDSGVPTTMSWPNRDTTDWARHAVDHYSQAIKLLRQTLKAAQRVALTISDEHEPTAAAEISDETLAAMAILCNFEFMSASDPEWSRHLSGTMLVLNLQQTGIISLLTSSPSQSRKAIFWNFFRQDVYAAFILETRTRLDLEDLNLWRAAGLAVDDNGLVEPSNDAIGRAMKDDLISNALLWILAKLFNYMADTKMPEFEPTSAHEQRWNDISHQLQVWYDGLPESFQPCARVERTASEPATGLSPLRPKTIPDIWFTSSMCASTIQTYHLARILLLAHKPRTENDGLRRSSVFNFINGHRTVEAELRYRSREIFGIALASPTTSIMLHQTQTIFVAAQCLVDQEERYMALDILRRVNTDLGWETEYRVQQLLKEWAWDVS